jgi:hypothetical protein
LSTPQPAVTSAAAILLDGISAAVADRPGLTPERSKTRITELWAVIDSFRPEDPLQIMLVGQAVMFNELLADGARDVLGGMADALKLRAQSNLNGMNRSLHQNLSLFLRLRDTAEAVSEAAREAAEPRQPLATARKAAAAATPGAVPAEAHTPPVVAQAEPEAKPAIAEGAAGQAAATPVKTDNPAAGPEQANAAPSTVTAAEATSWLDEPYTTWVIETPAAAHAREIAEQAARESAEAAPRTAEMHHFDEAMTEPRPGRRQRTTAPAFSEAALSALQRVEVPELVGTF